MPTCHTIRRRFLPSLAVTAVVVYAIWQIGYFGVYPNVIFSPPPEDSVPVAALDQIVSLHFDDIPLASAIEKIEQKYAVEIQLRTTMESTGIDTVGNCHLDGVPLRFGLWFLMRDAWDRDVVVESVDGTIVIADKAAWYKSFNNFTTKVYSLDGLLTSGRRFTEQQLVDAIEIFGHFEFDGGLGTITAIPGGLIVTQTPDIHRQINRLLDELEQLDDRVELVEPIILDDASRKNRKQLLTALEQPTEIDIANKTRPEICAELSRKHNVPIVFVPIEDSLETMNEIYRATNEQFISTRWQNIRLRSALQLLCEYDDYDIDLRDGVILVSPREYIEERLSVRAYPDSSVPGSLDSSSLSDLAKTTVSPEAWMSVGGPSSFAYAAGMLFVRQSELEHREVEALFEQLWHLDHVETDYQQSVEPTNNPSTIERRITQTLLKGVKPEPCSPIEFLRHFHTEYGFNIWVDQEVAHFYPSLIADIAKDDFRFDPNPYTPRPTRTNETPSDENNPFGNAEGEDPFDPVNELQEPKNPFGGHEPSDTNDPIDTKQKKKPGSGVKKDRRWTSTLTTRGDGRVSLAVALRSVLRLYELTCDIKNDSILITTPEAAEANLNTRVYPVDWLASDRRSLQPTSRLVNLVTLVDPDSWDDMGGPGTVEVIENSLIVTQINRVHDHISTLLNQLRQQAENPARIEPVWAELYGSSLNTPVEQLLEQPYSLQTKQQTLREFAEWIEREHQIVVDFELDDLDAGLDDVIPPVAINAPLRTCINLVLGKLRLTSVVDRGDLLITSTFDVYDDLPVRIYGVADLVDAIGEQNEIDLEHAIDVCLGTMHMEHHATYGHITSLNDMLVVQHTYDAHRTIERFLTGLRQMTLGDQDVRRKLLDLINVGADPQQKIARAFAKPFGQPLEQTPIVDVINAIAQRHDLSIALTVCDTDFDIQKKITISTELAERPLGKVLHQIAYDHRLRLGIDYGIVFVTDIEVPRPVPSVRFYDVGDLRKPTPIGELLRAQIREPIWNETTKFSQSEFRQHVFGTTETSDHREFDKIMGPWQYVLIGNVLAVAQPDKFEAVEQKLAEMRNAPRRAKP